MKSVFKKFKNIALAFLGFAFIGGLSIACLPKHSPAKGLLADDSASISYNNGAFYSLDGSGSDPLVLSSINFYGDITYENGSADLVFVNGNSDRVGSLRMINIAFNDKPTGDGTYYTGYISGILETTQQLVEEYFSNGARFWHEEVFDPEHEEWTWDEGARAYSCDYTPAWTGITITYKALFLPPSGATGVDQIICEYTPGSGVANVRTTIYNHNDGDPIETGMTKNFEFLLADEPSLQGDDYYEFQFGGTTGTNTFSIAAIYVSIVEEPTPGGEELTFVILNTRELELDEGDTSELLYQFSPSSYEGTFEWHSNNENVAKVSDLGGYAEVTAVGPGTATISITSVEYPNIYDECVVTVNERSYVMYTVTYDPNGADGDIATDSTEWVLEGDGAIYNLLHSMFERPNYNFLGWSTDPSSATPNYEEGEQVYLFGDTHYYAVWEYQEPEYYTREICFDPANGDNYITKVVEGETLPLSYEISEDLTPTYEGHTFLGWYYEGIIYQPGDVIRDISESIVLVAQWEETAQEIRYTITYYPNGAVGETFEGYTDYTSGDSSEVNYTFESCPDDYYMGGYYFAGWSSSQGGEEAEFIAGETYLVNQDLHVYAVWVLEEQDPETQAEITSLVLLENPQAYYFVGDVIDFTNIILVANYSDGSTKEVYSNEYVAYFSGEGEVDPYQPLVSGDYALYFTYEGVSTERGVPIYVNEREPETYEFEIIFVANDGTSETRTNSFTHSESSYTYDLPSSEQIGFTREGYSFVGWSYYSDGEVLKEAPVIESGTTTFYAIWESTAPQGTEYIIKFNGNGATRGSMEDDSFVTTYQDYQYSFPYELPECTYSKDGYAFVGWGLTETALLKWQPGETRDIEPGETTFYAIWAEIFNITFDANGGTGYMEPISVNSGTRSTVPGCDFVRDGYSFAGWAVNSPDSEAIVQPEDTVSVNQDYVLYALWELVGPSYQYTVTFDGNGATSGSTDSVILSGDDYSQTIVFPVCGYEREGYIFKGWGFNSEAIKTYKPGEERTDITSDTTFYAIWTQVFTISFDANGGEGMMEDITIPQGNATMPECSFTREGYSFAGWAVGSPTGDVYPTGESVYVSANYVLFATWEAITPITEIEISVAEPEVILYVDDSYIVQYTVTPEDAAGELIWEVEDEKVASVIEDGMLVGLSVGSTTVTISDRSGNTSVSFAVYVVEKPVPVQPENPISEETVEQINDAMDTMELTGGQIGRINEAINTNSDYLSDEAGNVIYEALLGTTINSDDPIVAEAQKELVVTVVETAVQVDAGKATSISDAQEIDKALPENANFSVEGEIDEFYQRQMYELFGGNKPTRLITRAGAPTYEINTDTDGKSGQEGAKYLKDQQALYENMVDFVDKSVDHMGKAALKLRKCSGESVTVQVKSYVTRVKVSSFREFDKEAADKEFVEAAYKAILLSMQNEVISILEKEHKPSNNAEKEAQYTKELEAVKDIESFEIMVTEVLRQKYVALTGENIEDVDAFHPIYWEIFSAWALDKQSPYPITLEELTQTTIQQSTSRARAFTVNSDLTGGEWGFIAGIIAGSAAIITAAAVIPTVLKKRRAKEGNK